MSKIAVVYHSGYGHTAEIAKAVARGAAGLSGVDSQLISVTDISKHWDDLKLADAIIFGTPTYMGGTRLERQSRRRFLAFCQSGWRQIQHAHAFVHLRHAARHDLDRAWAAAGQ